MPLYPDKIPTAACPGAPKAGSAPWNAADLLELGARLAQDDDPLHVPAASLPPMELLHVPRLPASASAALPAPAQRPVTVYDITQGPAPDCRAAAPLLPILLQRTAPGPAVPAQDAAHHAGLRDIAASPLASLPCELSFPGDLLLSTPPSSLHPLRHVTPEFDSTHQIMRIPPQATQTGNTPALSSTLDNAWLARLSQPTTPIGTAMHAVTQSAPSAPRQMPALQSPMPRAFDEDDAFLQALAGEREHVAALRALELPGSGAVQEPAPLPAPQPPLLRLSPYRRPIRPDAPDNETGPFHCDITPSDAVELVGDWPYLAM